MTRNGIGIRIEDDILITQNGPVNLLQVPRAHEAIEAKMKERALRQLSIAYSI